MSLSPFERVVWFAFQDYYALFRKQAIMAWEDTLHNAGGGFVADLCISFSWQVTRSGVYRSPEYFYRRQLEMLGRWDTLARWLEIQLQSTAFDADFVLP